MVILFGYYIIQVFYVVKVTSALALVCALKFARFLPWNEGVTFTGSKCRPRKYLLLQTERHMLWYRINSAELLSLNAMGVTSPFHLKKKLPASDNWSKRYRRKWWVYPEPPHLTGMRQPKKAPCHIPLVKWGWMYLWTEVSRGLWQDTIQTRGSGLENSNEKCTWERVLLYCMI